MTDATFDPDAFRRFEHDGWDRLHAGYHTAWEHLTTQVVPPLLDGVGAGSGTDLLDVASGPGYVAAAAATRGANAMGLDFAPNMVRLAREAHPGVHYRQGDAEALPFDDASFDAVTINFGILHFPHADTALAETFRVLRPGGRLGFTNWAGPKGSAIGIAMAAVSKHGRQVADLPAGTPVFRFADHGECARTLSETGFADVASRDHLLTWHLPRPFKLMEAFASATARTSGQLAAQDPETLPAISAAMSEGCEPYAVGDTALLPMPCVLTVGRKPRR